MRKPLRLRVRRVGVESSVKVRVRSWGQVSALVVFGDGCPGQISWWGECPTFLQHWSPSASAAAAAAAGCGK